MKIKQVVAFSLLFLISFSALVLGQEKLVILHWNDFHSYNAPYHTNINGKTDVLVGGYATLKGFINRVKNEKGVVALVHAGDEFQGTPISTITQGRSQIKLLNLIQPDVFTLGNHEFDYGIPRLRENISVALFPIISANLFDKEQGALFLKPYQMVNYGNLKVGYIGLMTPELNQLTLRDNIKGLRVLEPATVVRKYISVIKDSVDLIIVVSHMGVDEDKKLAEKVSGISLIIGGHSHTPLFEPVRLNGVYICQAGSKGKYMGKIELAFDKETKKIVSFESTLVPLLADSIEQDAIVAEVVDSLEQIVDNELSTVIGELKTDWIRHHRKESNVGNWQADVMREYAGTDVAFQNSGGIRKNLKAGKITIRDMWELNPFSNYFGVFKMTGAEIKKTLERNSSGEGEFLQVSGIKYKFKPDNPTGQKVVEVLINGAPLQDDREYTVCSNNFLIGIFYKAFNVPPANRKIHWLKGVDRDVFIDAVKQQRIISSYIEGRIEAVH